MQCWCHLPFLSLQNLLSNCGTWFCAIKQTLCHRLLAKWNVGAPSGKKKLLIRVRLSLTCHRWLWDSFPQMLTQPVIGDESSSPITGCFALKPITLLHYEQMIVLFPWLTCFKAEKLEWIASPTHSECTAQICTTFFSIFVTSTVFVKRFFEMQMCNLTFVYVAAQQQAVWKHVILIWQRLQPEITLKLKLKG